MTKAPKAPAPWCRETAARYRSSDERFAIEADSPGHWYISDAATRDELGLPRTLGPYATLAEAKVAADARRDQAPDASPLADRVTAARSAPTRPVVRPAPRPSPPPKPPTWLERLEAADPSRARHARRLVGALETLGITDGDATVRRDVETDEPAIAEALLAGALVAALAEVLPPDVGDAGGIEVILGAVLSVISDQGRLEGSDQVLPGWALVEMNPKDPEAHRRLRLTAGDVAARLRAQ